MKATNTEVSRFRLIALRAMYLLIAVAMGAQVWPRLVLEYGTLRHPSGTVTCMMAALTLLTAVGFFRPLLMLPLLVWETIWKTLWLIVIALPAWRGGTMDPVTTENTFACALVVLIYAVIPWGYVARRLHRPRASATTG